QAAKDRLDAGNDYQVNLKAEIEIMALLEKVEQVVRLIRAKGVGVYFVTQNPADIPDTVLAQLGNRIQHALRAYTPSEQKGLK
uniref:helicase HerA-like domain-containing protein n=1 Tax=Klebsiella pneumoniae TaxID=573 RepID=UPI001E45EDD9